MVKVGFNITAETSLVELYATRHTVVSKELLLSALTMMSKEQLLAAVPGSKTEPTGTLLAAEPKLGTFPALVYTLPVVTALNIAADMTRAYQAGL